MHEPADIAAAPPSDADDALSELLKRQFGHEQFRPMQRQIITDALAGRDALVVMPTGGGKSLCYQLPAVATSGVTLVVSPLIALMQDQVQALTANGVSATVLNSSVERAVIYEREQAAAAGHYQLIYMAPERLASAAGMRLLSRLNVSRFAIDEAHCISEWGHDFRPEYRQLGALRQRWADVPVMALTATATRRVADDIVAQLHLRQPAVFRAPFQRKNLNYQVQPKQRAFDRVLRYLRDRPDAEGIIYCHSRAGAENWAAKLVDNDVAALPYHAGLDHDVRRRNQHAFIYGDTRVMTATIAFGMGVDKPDVRFVIHADLPRNLEGYYQETGRAGRDGLPADCILFFSAGDRAKIERFITEKQSEHERELAAWQLEQVIQFAYTTGCRCVPLLGYFGEQHEGDCGHCDNCLQPPKLQDATEDARKLLSAVARTGQRFGLAHVIDVLRGDESEKIARHGHDQLSVFGIGGQTTRAHWRRVAETLIHAGQLAQTPDEFRTAHLTGDSVPVLRGQVEVHVTLPRAIATDRPRRGRGRDRGGDRGRGVVDASLDAAFDPRLFDILRELRRRIAGQQAVPPYVVFSDVSLREMAARKPRTAEQFAAITGVGQYKLTTYGQAFTRVIDDYDQGRLPDEG